MNTAAIHISRKKQIQAILAEQDLQGVLVCNGIRENLDSWLLAGEEIPTLQPFGRLNLFLISATGDALPLCAYQNHPCDFPHYELFDPAMVPPYVSRHRLGIVNPECLLEITRKALLELDPALSFIDLTECFLRAKARKSAEELAAIKVGIKFFDNVFCAMPWYLREGQTEAQVAVDVRRVIGTLGVKNPMLFEDPMATTLVDLTSAPRDGVSEEVLYYPGRRLRRGDRVNLNIHSYLHGGFSAALGRCYILSQASEENRRRWDAALETQDRLARLLRPGGTIAAAISQVNAEYVIPNGFLPLTGNCVYGIGCSRCEAPRNADASRDMLLGSGMVLVLSPAVSLPGQDPYRCTDVFVVTETGAERLTHTPRELIEL